MGRPLNKKYFGNRNVGSASTTTDNGIGGQSVASVTVTTAGSYTVAPTGILFSNPLLENLGGVRATGSIATYKVVSATISGGTGYGNAQTFNLTVTTAAGSAVLNVTSNAGGAITTVTLATSYANFKAGTAMAQTTATGSMAWVASQHLITAISGGTGSGGVLTQVLTTAITTGQVGGTAGEYSAIRAVALVSGSVPQYADIVKQVSTRRYKVEATVGTGICKLVATAPTVAGTMTITATDAAGGTYYVTKLTNHKATLSRGTGTVYTEGAAIPWTFGTATSTVCKIENA